MQCPERPILNSSDERLRRRGISTKAILITLAVICGLGLLMCAGGGVVLYYVVKKNLENLMVTDPVKIRSLTDEMVDISLPPEFVPQRATSLFGVTHVAYGWCPTGTCKGGESSELMITTMNVAIATTKTGEKGTDPKFSEETDSDLDNLLKSMLIHYTKELHEFEIRGQKCKFVIATGESSVSNDDAEQDDSSPAVSPEVASDQTPAKPIAEDDKTSSASDQPPASDETPTTDEKLTDGEKPTGDKTVTSDKAPAISRPNRPKTVFVHGQFPGKKSVCTLDLTLKPEDFDKEKILTMIRSIH